MANPFKEKKKGRISEDDEDLKERCIDLMREYAGNMTLLQSDQAEAIKRYRGDAYAGDENLVNRSKFVSSDIFDTIEWIMPSLMRIFFGGASVVNITARGETGTNDIETAELNARADEAAKLLNEKCNYDIQYGLNGFILFNDWFRDALLQKIGVVKFWWEKEEESEGVEFNLDAAGFEKLSSMPDILIDSVEEVSEDKFEFDASGFPLPPVVTYNVKGRRVKKQSQPRAEVVPPEEIIYDVNCKRIKESELVVHRVAKHKKVVAREYGIPEEELELEIENWGLASDIAMERFADLGSKSFLIHEMKKDWIYVNECYVTDYSTGEAVPKIVKICGTKLLCPPEENKYGYPPFCEVTPLKLSHRAVGMSMADMVKEFQKLRSVLIRYCLDNVYYQNNGRVVVNPYRVNVDDVLNNNFPGGIVRLTQDVEPFQAMRPIEVTPLAPHVFALMEQVQGWIENKTGVTRYNQGLDSQSLNKTATGISQIMAASQQRIELLARCFAETGVKDLFHNLAEMNINFLDIPTAIRINKNWKTVKPEDIDVDYRVIIDVGIGTGTKDMLIQQMMQIINISAPMMQIGVVTSENVYQQMRTLLETMGYKNTDSYITKPQPPPPPQPMPPQGGMNGAGQPAGVPNGPPGAGIQGGPGPAIAGPPPGM